MNTQLTRCLDNRLFLFLYGRLRVFALILASIQCTVLQAASFNCSEAKTKPEKLVCSSREIGTLDALLGDIFYYRTHRGQATAAEVKLLRFEQRNWLRSFRDVCLDLNCLRETYSARIAALESVNKSDDWITDGRWYIYTRDDVDARAKNPVSSYGAADNSDVLLTQYRGIGQWLLKRRVATPDEIQEVIRKPFGMAATLCENARVAIEDSGNANLFDHLAAKVVIRDAKNNTTASFILYREVQPTKRQAGASHEQSKTGGLVVPLTSAIFALAALPDCTFLAQVEEGVIRFTAQGTTEAVLPHGTRLL